MDKCKSARPINDIASIRAWVKKVFSIAALPGHIDFGVSAYAVGCGPLRSPPGFLAFDWHRNAPIPIVALDRVLNSSFDSVAFGSPHDLIVPPQKLPSISYSGPAPTAHQATIPELVTLVTKERSAARSSKSKTTPRGDTPHDGRCGGLLGLPDECLHSVAMFLSRHDLETMMTCCRSLAGSIKAVSLFHPRIHLSELMFAWPITSTATWRAVQSITLVIDLQAMDYIDSYGKENAHFMWRVRLAWATWKFGAELIQNIAKLPALCDVSFQFPSNFVTGFTRERRASLESWLATFSSARHDRYLVIEWPIDVEWDEAKSKMIFPWSGHRVHTALRNQSNRWKLNLTIWPQADLLSDDSGSYEAAARHTARAVLQAFSKQTARAFSVKLDPVQVQNIRVCTHYRTGRGSHLHSYDPRSIAQGRRSRFGTMYARHPQWVEFRASDLAAVNDITMSAWPHVDVYCTDDNQELYGESGVCGGTRATFMPPRAAAAQMGADRALQQDLPAYVW